jgi:Bacterial lectin/Caspase domain
MPNRSQALIVACDRYDDPGLRELRAPARDIRALAGVLADPAIGDFDVKTLFNEPAHIVNLSVEDFFADRGTDDLLLLYFSCHGVKDDGGRLYFASANTQLRRLGATAVSSAFVNEQMDSSRSRKIMLFLDCCYSGAFFRGMTPRAGAGIDINERFEGRGRAVITASTAMEYAFEPDDTLVGEGRPSIFTEALVRGLETGEADQDEDGRVSVDELYDYVYEQVRRATPTQTPSKLINVQGALFIARSNRPPPLPQELVQAVKSPFPGVRAAVVPDLERLLNGHHKGLAATARRMLSELANDDSRLVASAAEAALTSTSGDDRKRAAAPADGLRREARPPVVHERARQLPTATPPRQPTKQPRTAPPHRTSPRRWLPILAGLAVAAAVAIGIYAALPRDEPGPACPTSSTNPGMALVGDATDLSDGFRLTPSEQYQSGAVWSVERTNVQNPFTVEFRYKITKSYGGGTNGVRGADGFAFLIQNDGRCAIGSGGYGLGYDGIRNSLAVEFDLAQNQLQEDPNPPHIGIHTRGNEPNSTSEQAAVVPPVATVSLTDRRPHTVRITYIPGRLAVYLDDTLELTAPVVLEDTIDLTDGKAWIGLTAATGTFTAQHDVSAFMRRSS